MDTKETLREATSRQIIDAASTRFMHYGYAKTTMAEIARDLNMSTGNLYRFFPSKLDIATEIALSHEGSENEQAEAIVTNGRPARERLEVYFRNMLTHTFTVIAESRKVFEVAQAITQERPEFANRRLKIERGYLVRILADGIADGSFAPVEDLDFTAEMMQCMVMKFRYPQLWNCNDLALLKRELEGVLALMFCGLSRR
jgi:AcrR family transcriptional regulator